MVEVLVVGSFVQDLAFRTAVFPNPGETRIGKFFAGPGGKGFNQAVACQRQSVNTKFIGAVGEDVFAAGLREFAKNERLSMALQKVSNFSTGVASIVVDAKGQNQIIVDLAANDHLDPDFVEKEFESVKVVLVQVESNLDSALRALELGKKNAAFNILNPAPINSGIGQRLLELSDIITPNETEFSFLHSHLLGSNLDDSFWQSSDADIHRACRSFGIPTVILTLGDKGSFVSLQTEYFRVAPIRVTARDTTGAGDAFSGGLAAGIVKFDGDITKAVRYATVVAGLSTEREGTAPAMPSLAEVQARVLSEFNIEI